MTYLRALGLLVKAYKAAKGVMPKGLDLLKMKMKARQKVIDANKVIEFPKERITDWTKARPKGLARYEGGGEGIKKLIDKGLIRIGEVTKRKKVKEPVDPKLYQQERIKEIMKQNKEAAKRLEKKMNKDKKAEDYFKEGDYDPGGMANGGIANLTSVYNQNPSLQSQYTLDEYLDLFDNQTVTPQIQTSADILEQAQPNPINPIKPIIPLPESSGDGGGSPPPGGGITAGINFDYGYTSPSGEFNLDDIGEGTVADEDYTLGMRARDALSGIQQVGQGIYSAISPIQIAKRTKDAIDDMRAKRAAEIIEQIRREEEARLQAQLNKPRVPGGTIDSGNQGSGGYGGTGGEGPSAVGSSGMLGGGV
tara:strand:+ start:120 stop:1211 length:1092 start_codon:yes stop_codon:yes gene_type:complete